MPQKFKAKIFCFMQSAQETSPRMLSLNAKEAEIASSVGLGFTADDEE